VVAYRSLLQQATTTKKAKKKGQEGRLAGWTIMAMLLSTREIW